jgi:phosphate/sulfate permease
MQFNKQRIFEIFITALLSAGIAFLQSLATSHFIPVSTEQTVTVAGVVGAGIRALKVC